MEKGGKKKEDGMEWMFVRVGVTCIKLTRFKGVLASFALTPSTTLVGGREKNLLGRVLKFRAQLACVDVPCTILVHALVKISVKLTLLEDLMLKSRFESILLTQLVLQNLERTLQICTTWCRTRGLTFSVFVHEGCYFLLFFNYTVSLLSLLRCYVH